MGNRRHERIPAMDYRQYRRARRLVRECCNYDNGQCMALDEGTGASVSRAFPTPCSAAGSVRQCCP